MLSATGHYGTVVSYGLKHTTCNHDVNILTVYTCVRYAPQWFVCSVAN